MVLRGGFFKLKVLGGSLVAVHVSVIRWTLIIGEIVFYDVYIVALWCVCRALFAFVMGCVSRVALCVEASPYAKDLMFFCWFCWDDFDVCIAFESCWVGSESLVAVVNGIDSHSKNP